MISSLSRTTRSCGSLALLMRYSRSPLPGSCLVTSKTPAGTNRLIAGLMTTISPTLNLWDGIGASPFPGRIPLAVTLIQLTGRMLQGGPDAPSHGRTLIQTSDYPASLRGLSIGSGIIYSRNGEDQRQLRAEEGEKPEHDKQHTGRNPRGGPGHISCRIRRGCAR